MGSGRALRIWARTKTEHDPDQLYYNTAKLDTNPFGTTATIAAVLVASF